MNINVEKPEAILGTVGASAAVTQLAQIKTNSNTPKLTNRSLPIFSPGRNI